MTRIKEVIRGKYFPSVSDLVSVARTYALQDDAVLPSGRQSLMLDDKDNFLEELGQGTQHSTQRRRYRPCVKPPLDMQNLFFEMEKQRRSIDLNHNHIKLNKKAIRRQSDSNRLQRSQELENTFFFTPSGDHRYSSMKRSNSVVATEQLRNHLRSQHGAKSLFSYSDKFHMSGAFSMRGEDEQQQEVLVLFLLKVFI